MPPLDYGSCTLEDPSKEIRLISLSPSPTFTSRLECSLFTAPLANPDIPFKALSYVWGPDVAAEGMDTIRVTLVNGTNDVSTIPITPSLSTALRNIRPMKGKLTLWIDQICIDQSNLSEKGPQVALMGKLYASASQVLVWLGPPAHGSDEVMDAWQATGYAARAWGMEGYYAKEKIGMLHAMMGNEYPRDEKTRALQDIMKTAAGRFAPLMKEGKVGKWFGREWFTRVWVVQEFCMCADTVKLFVFRETLAKNHRDRVFALLGLAVDAEELSIRPDYAPERTVASILTEAARAMIENGDAIAILCYSQFPKLEDIRGLPSWVPDWRSCLQPSFYTITEKVDPHLYAASGDSAVEVVPSKSADLLGLQGYFVDTIDQVAEDAWDDMSSGHVRYLRFLNQFDDLYQASMEKQVAIYGEKTQEGKEQARWRVPIGDVYWTQREGRARATPDVAVEHGRCVAYLRAFHDLEGLDGSEFRDGYAKFQEINEAGLYGMHYRESMTIMKGKRPFLTRDGRLGMGPSEAVPGDAVVVFCGGRIPFVVRPKTTEEDVFAFIGEAYCDGVMDGEVLTGERRVFVLE
ncbi:heterokaryon incompatibility protein-domain-containing protein [Immersiella caudata]|uniref:Heterokaryon incompatibility protein-domain-containing protein n=1 Tax=Immersiella caudata TaxID=314043 RepID=A0AA39WB73_9PEZI|nr:heterokaryon incompatibility protein-domain-containing protein [Immersiella caudata]